jgi:hypothetical protein
VLLLREPCRETGIHWSALDMAVNFFWGNVNRLMAELSIEISASHENMKLVEVLGGPGDPRVVNDPNLPEAIRQSIAGANWIIAATDKLLSELKCDHIDFAAKSLANWVKQEPHHWSELNARSRALRNAIEIELKQYLYYQYPKHKGDKFKSWKEDWKAPVGAFPAIEREVFHATDCYALGHNTASVFHSMRVAEHGLRALAKERKIKLPKNKQVEWATWQELIRALDDEIKLIGSSKKAGAAKDAALEFYSGARADLNGFKDEYRNLVSHVRATYDVHQALRALTNVNSFMGRIAAKIDHKHHRIRWGLR